ncbi:unnamed protein product [Symbiodinium microadriaticum]|nr:unnamed protein product [Symbiodinium microadriaticum]
MTENVLVVVDGAAWDKFKDIPLPAEKMKGFKHGVPKSPYRNVALGLYMLSERHPDADWYCYCEEDVLFTSPRFRYNLQMADRMDVWMLGSDGHVDNKQMALIESLVGGKLTKCYYLLGCCQFFSKKFINKLKEINFFERFLALTNEFPAGHFPNYDGYDISEHLYPTLARHFGGNIGVFATWDREEQQWHGSHEYYPIRWKPELDPETESFPQVMGLIFDMTLEHHEKRRLLDIVKQQVIQYIREDFIDDDQFYLYHPQVTEVLWKLGEQVAAVGNYETDGWKFDLEYALKQTLYVVGAEDEDSPKLICVISNRQRDPWLYKKLLKINDKDAYGCNVLHIALGESGEEIDVSHDRRWNMADQTIYTVKPGMSSFDFDDDVKMQGPVNIKARPVNSTDSLFDSPVDIIIPYHGQYDSVMQLLDSIFRFTRSNFYRVTVIDDHSPNESFIQTMSTNASKHAQVTKRSNIFKALRCAEHKGFAGAIKAGWERTKLPYVCFLNSDCLIHDINWLRGMGDTLLRLKSEGVRMVSARSNNPVNGSKKQKAERGEEGQDQILEMGDHLSMYCFLCHRDLFDHCGGFIKEYPYGWYEDEEFAYRMHKYGFKQAVSGTSWVQHFGEKTVKYVQRNNPKVQDIMENKNRDRCIEDIQKLGLKMPSQE